MFLHLPWAVEFLLFLLFDVRFVAVSVLAPQPDGRGRSYFFLYIADKDRVRSPAVRRYVESYKKADCRWPARWRLNALYFVRAVSVF